MLGVMLGVVDYSNNKNVYYQKNFTRVENQKKENVVKNENVQTAF